MRFPWFAALLAVVVAPAAQAQTLVRDINPTGDSGPSTDPGELTAHLGALFYVGEDTANGPDLRRMDAAGAVTFLLDSRESFDGPTEVTAAGSWLFFVADQSLYRTDGTAAGTTRVRQFPSDQLHSLTYANGVVFFTRNVGGPQELWRSDGTDAGTISLGASDPDRLTAAGNRLFFQRDTAPAGLELWTSDGSVAGTHMVADICPGPCDGVDDDELEAVGSTVYFVGDDAVHGPELWRSDGTLAGTAMVQDSVPGAMGLSPSTLSSFGSRVLFSAYDGSAGLWISDGTSLGTRRLKQELRVEPLIHDAGSIAFFGAQDLSGMDPVDGLWLTDGTPAGTRLVSPVCPGGCSYILSYGTLGGVTLFTPYQPNLSELWRTDGTAAGTFPFSPHGVAPFTSMEPFGNALYYSHHDLTIGSELWRTDGTAAGTVPVTDRRELSSYPAPLAHVGNRMFFSAQSTDIGNELWSTTGTSASTSALDLNPGPASSFFSTSIALGNDLVFGHYSGSGSLRKTDGTPAGTATLDPDLGVFSAFALAGGVAVTAGGGPNGGNVEPWRTDGTVAGTLQVADLAGDLASSSPTSLASFRGRVVFAADGLGDSVWSTDGTAEGTYRITSRPCDRLAPGGDKLFMRCSDAVTGLDVWVTDGTELGTRLVRDLATGYVDELVAVEQYLYFKDDNWTLWRSDGTEAGTQKVEDLTGFPVGSLAQTLTAARGLLFYIAHTPATGFELWRTDGTPAGTFLLRDIWPGPDSSVLGGWDMAAAGRFLIFGAYTPATGREPWLSDGTTAGTVPMQEIAPGPASSQPQKFAYAPGRVYFSADDNVSGFEPWSAQLGGVSVSDAILQEGDAGVTNAVFEVNLSLPILGYTTVFYTTVAGTAQAGTDFTPQSGSVTFPPFVTSASVSVPVLGDLQDETDETFTLELLAPAPFADSRGLGLVLDDDAPAATIASANAAEGNAGNTGLPFVVTLTTRDGNPAVGVKTVGFTTSPVTATPGIDYFATAGTLTFAAGTPSGSTMAAQVPVIGDTFDEPDETFRVSLTPTSDVTVPVVAATGTIDDDDGIAALKPIELAHGSVVRATLEPPAGRTSDRDWYVLRQQPRASYEIVVDETSGDAVPLQVERIASDGSTVLQSGTATGTGASVSLRWENSNLAAVANEPIRVGSAACGSSCGADDGYRLRLFETTLSASRVNNTASQVTVAILQNATNLTISGRIQFWTSYGFPSTQAAFQLTARQALVVNTSTVFESAGTLTVTHDGPYGSLVGKAVALEPATGFSFDTPMSYRPR